MVRLYKQHSTTTKNNNNNNDSSSKVFAQKLFPIDDKTRQEEAFYSITNSPVYAALVVNENQAASFGSFRGNKLDHPLSASILKTTKSIKAAIFQNFPIGHAIQGDPAGQAKVPQTSLHRNIPGQRQQNLLCHNLNRRCQVHITLGDGLLWCARWPTKQPFKGRIRHRQTRAIVKVFQVESK